jgi:hypothetical protein
MDRGGKVIVANDRSLKQPVRAFCTNPECLESSDQEHFEFTVEHSPVECPKCGANQPPMIGVLSLVHFLIRDKKGPIIGHGGLRYLIACEEKRAYLATITNEEAVTGVFESANCPGCIAKAQKLGIVRSGFALVLQGS